MPVPEIDIETFAAVHRDGAFLLDVRTPEEFVAGHVPGVRNIPLPEIPEHLDEIPRDRAVYIICASGGRSQRAAEWLAAQGIDAANVAGGTKAWIESGRSTSAGSAP